MRIVNTAPDTYSVDHGLAIPRKYDVTTRSCHAIDALEALLVKLPQAECPVVHRFTPGLYSRECFTPANIVATSRIHLMDHQFILSMGSVAIFCDGKGWVDVMSPYHGITPAGTRRVIRTYEDTICTTFHPTAETDLGKLDALLYLAHDGPQAHASLQP